MEVILQIESIVTSQRCIDDDFYVISKNIDKNGATLLLGDGRIVTYDLLEQSQYASQLVCALSNIPDLEENDKLIKLYNIEKQYLHEIQFEKDQVHHHTQIIDNMYLSMIKAWIQKYKKKFVITNSIDKTNDIMNEKAEHYEMINKWFVRISMKHKNEYLSNIQRINTQYEPFHVEMKQYVDKYVMEIEEQVIFD